MPTLTDQQVTELKLAHKQTQEKRLADRIRQQQFLSVYDGIKNNLSPNDQIYFVDSTHPEHNTKPSYGWILKGKANDKFVKTNTG